MTDYYKNEVTKEHLPYIIAVLRKNIFPGILYDSAIMVAAIMLSYLVLAKIWPVASKRIDAMDGFEKNANRLLMAMFIALIVATILGEAFNILKKVVMLTALNDMAKTGIPDGCSYSILKPLLATKRIPKDNTLEADTQEALLGLWLCLNEGNKTEFNPGYLPVGHITITATSGHNVYTEEFMLPARHRLMKYWIEDGCHKHISVRKGDYKNGNVFRI